MGEASLHEFSDEIRPLLTQFCVGCHGPEKQSAELRLDTLDPDLVGGADSEPWHDVLDRLNLGEMPPPKAPQPSADERSKLTGWITVALKQAAEAERYRQGRVTTRRLTRYEYQNTMQDLLGVHLDFAKDLPPEPPSADGFLNDAAVLEMSPAQVEAYLDAARRGLAEAIVSGPQPQVHRHLAEKTAVGKLPNRKVQGRDPVQPEFLVDLQTFPRRGEFLIRIQAGAVVPSGEGYPRVRVSLGFVPGIIHVPRKLVGEAEVTAPPEAPQTIEFRGRIEDFPQPGDVPFGNVDFDGMIALIDFLDADGNQLRYPDRMYATPKADNKKKANKKKANKKKAGKQADPAEASQDVDVGADKPLPKDRLDIVVRSVEFQAPVVDQWPPASHERILIASDLQNDESRYAREVVRRFMTRAFRRPARDDEVERTAELFERLRPRMDSFEEAIRETLASVLVSPHFLYLVEPRQGTTRGEAVSDHELASRLSYFLWSTMPDEALMKLADEGRLRDPQVLAQQVQRMLDEPRSGELLTRLADQWFDLDALDRVAVNPEFFPEFDNRLKDDMRAETRAFFAEIVRSDLSALQLLDSDWAMLNRSLARHYGLPVPRSSQLQRMPLPEGSPRGGLLAQGSFLLSNSNGESSHPIKRAVWTLDRLLDSPPAPPPPDVPELEADKADAARLSLKDQLAAHRSKESCRSCHQGIDPWGVPLEQFDAVGRWRGSADDAPAPDKRKPAGAAAVVDASSVLPDGAAIDGVSQLKRHLLDNRSELFARSVVKRTAAYALGRSLDLGDREAIEGLANRFVEADFRIRSLISDLVQSELFLTK